MKKLLKIVAAVAAVCVVLVLAALLALKLIFPAEKLRAMAQNYAANYLHREVTFSKVSFNLIGVTVHDLAISESTTFEQGTFLKAKKAVVKLSLMPLLRKHIDISTVGLNGLDLYITKNADGTFNFDDLTKSNEEPAEEEQQPKDANQENELGFSLLAKYMYAHNCNVYYKDIQGGTTASLTNINLDVHHFDLASPFTVKASVTTDYTEKLSKLSVRLPITAELTVDLASLNMDKAYAKLTKLHTQYETIKLDFNGEVKNFNKPTLVFNGNLSGVSNQALKAFAPDLPSFTLPTVYFNLDAAADFDNATANLSNAKITVADSSLSANGNVQWGADSPVYTFTSKLNLDLTQLATMTQLEGFGLGGKITGQVTATEKQNFQDVKGTVQLNNVTVSQAPVSVSDLDGTIQIAWPEQISSKNLTGLLNGEKFTASFTYKDLGNIMDIVFDLDLSKLVLTSFSTGKDTEQQTQENASAENAASPNNAQSTADTQAEPLFNVQANVNISGIEVPYFSSTGAALKAQLKKASPSMKQANGTVTFTLQEGSINDVTQFITGNKIVKILMFPLNVVKTVTSKLGIDIFPTQKEEDKGKIKFSSGSGSYLFTNGVMNIQETHFNSALSDMKATGKADFNTEKLDMKVTATVLTSQTPIVIKVGGTMSDPSGKLDIANTAVSLVGGILSYKTPAKVAGSAVKTTAATGHAVADKSVDAVKSTVGATVSTVKAIGGLFKKKSDKQEDEQTDTK